MRSLAAILLVSIACCALASADPCLGEFQVCDGGDCVLDASLCGKCSSGQYLCPDGVSCVNGATGYAECPNLKGTHFDWTLPIEARLDYLVQQATVTEKIAQLTNDAPAIVRLGIPSYNWLNDDEHGVMGTHSTVFPNGCSLGATWSKKSLREVGTAVGTEARGLHNGFVHSGNRGHNINGAGITMYAPNMNTVRDPRWGRAQEVYGEDPYLSSQLTVGFVVGGQGNNASNDYQVAAACCKHFVAYDLESLPTLRYVFDAQVNSRNMWETFLPVFKACVVQAQGAHVMCSYNAVNGVPTCAEPRLLNGVLRSQWGWDGFVVSDYDAWAMIYSTHGYCQNYTCAAAAGINAGMDQEGGGTIAIEKMQDAINQGLVNTSSVDEAFRRLFRARIRLGMLDPPTLVPWNYLSNDTTVVEGPKNIALARQVAREGMCLYKNQGNVLPLNANTINKLAIVGFQATQEGLLMGNYAEYPDAGIPSVLTAMVDALGQDKTAACTFEQDIDYYVAGQTGIYVFDAQACCDLCSSVSTCHYFTFYSGECYLKSNNSGRVSSPGRVSGSCNSNGKIAWQPGCYDVACTDQSGFAAAQQIAQGADATIVLLGLDQSVESEGNDRADITLSDGQQKLVAALRSAIPNKPLIAVLIHGGTLGFNGVDQQLDAILDAWYPGMQGANAIADVIFGLYNPAGRTPVTYYKSNSDLPAPGMMDLYPNNASSGLTYRYFKGQPLFPFGFGLSYTTFAYSNLQTDFETYSACQNMIVSVDVTNTGSMDGDEVVQLYLQQPEASVPVPSVRLAAFDRVHIAAGQTHTVTLIVEPESHSVVYDGFDVYDSSAVAVEAGAVDLFVGGGQPQFYQGHVATTVRVVNSRPLNDC